MADPQNRVEHLEKATRIMHTWTPGKIRMAKLQADGGSLMLVADLCEDIMADDSIIATLDVRARGVLGLPLSFEPAGDQRRASPITKALEKDWWFANPETQLLQAWRWAVLLGVAPAELVIKERLARVVPRLKYWHPRWLRFDWQTRNWELQTENGSTTLEVGGGKWVLFTPFGEHRPWALGTWRAVALWWLLKQYAITDWARYGEAHGKPIVAGVMPETMQGNAKARQELAEDLADLGSDTSVALPPGYDLKMVEAVANTWRTFQAQIEMADAGIAVALLGQNLTTRVSEGSRAAATIHDQVRSDLKRGDAEVLSTTLREQQTVFWAEWNFGNRELAPWAKWDTTPPEDLKTKAETFNTIGDALAKLQAAGVNTSKILEEFGLEPAQPNPPVTAPDQAQQAAQQLALNLLQRPVKLASGNPTTNHQAFLEGQLYTDALGDHALTLGAFKPQLKATFEVIDTAEDYEDLRSKLLEVYAGMNADEAQQLLTHALTLASLAGQYSAYLETLEGQPPGGQ